ncbi:MAG: hypothetical protein U9R42_04545 [Bacteroidota bacterium]|nr:hypothetical protein [Bacteroidota bacterium]
MKLLLLLIAFAILVAWIVSSIYYSFQNADDVCKNCTEDCKHCPYERNEFFKSSKIISV